MRLSRYPPQSMEAAGNLLGAVNQLVYSADGRGVYSVWVDGRRVVDNYRSTVIDEIETAGMSLLVRAKMTVPSLWPVL